MLFAIPLETLVAADPEVIVVGDATYGVCPADVVARPGWSGMTAVDEGAVRPVDDIPVTRPGPRLAEGLASLARAIHPDLELRGPAGRLRAAARRPRPRRAPSWRRALRRRARPRRGATGPRLGVRRRPVRLAIGGLVVLAVAIVAGIALGTVAVSPADTVAILAHELLGLAGRPDAGRTRRETIVMELRLPRVLTALIVGFGLAVAGTTFQGLLRNPLADPYVLGTASGAALGAAIGGRCCPVQVAFLGLGLVNLLAFVGALLAVGLVLPARRRRRALDAHDAAAHRATRSARCSRPGWPSRCTSRAQHLRQIFFYLLGQLRPAPTGRAWSMGLPLILVGSLLILVRARSLNALLLGDDTASHLGIDVRRERAILLGLASLVTAAAVALAGLIGFVGLVVPHVVRLLVGPNARLVLPLSALFGAAFLILADLVARIPGELPVGVVTAVVGAPVFLILLRRFRSGYEL